MPTYQARLNRIWIRRQLQQSTRHRPTPMTPTQRREQASVRSVGLTSKLANGSVRNAGNTSNDCFVLPVQPERGELTWPPAILSHPQTT